MNAIELLKNDHEKVSELFDKLETARGGAKGDLFKQIKAELDLHAHIEETIFYPALEGHSETHDITLEGYEEHKIIKELLFEIDKMHAVDDEWNAKVKVLKESVEHHVDEEEGEMFPKAGHVLSEQQIDQLGTRMESEKAARQGADGRRVVPPAKEKKTAGEKAGVLEKIASWVGISTTGDARKTRKTPTAKKHAPGKGKKQSSKTVAKKSAKTSKKSGRAASGRSAKASKKAAWAASGRSAKASKKTAARAAGGRRAKASKKPARTASGRSAKAKKSASKSAAKRGRKSSAGKKSARK